MAYQESSSLNTNPPFKAVGLGIVRRLALMLAYLGCYHWSYVSYVHPTWEYGHYYYFECPLELYVLFYLLAVFPLVFLRPALSVASFGAALIYLLSYAPGQLTILFMWTGSESQLVAVGLLLMLSMCVLLFTADVAKNARGYVSGGDLVWSVRVALHVLTVLSLAVLVIENRGHMRLVSFYDVYELRSEASTSAKGGISGYLMMWLALICVPYYAASAVIRKNLFLFLVSCGIALLSYMANGSKIALLMPFVVAGLSYFLKGDFLSRLTATLTVVLAVLMMIDQELVNFAKAILVARTLSVSGWTIAIYHEYFTTHGFTWFGHIGLVQALFDNYPFGIYAPGQLIGIDYSGSAEANFNAGFWASDGIAAIGVLGIVFITIPMAIFLLGIERLTRGFDSMLLCLWSTGFWVTLMNAPFTTAMLSGGGFLIVLALLSSRVGREIGFRMRRSWSLS